MGANNESPYVRVLRGNERVIRANGNGVPRVMSPPAVVCRFYRYFDKFAADGLSLKPDGGSDGT